MFDFSHTGLADQLDTLIEEYLKAVAQKLALLLETDLQAGFKAQGCRVVPDKFRYSTPYGQGHELEVVVDEEDHRSDFITITVRTWILPTKESASEAVTLMHMRTYASAVPLIVDEVYSRVHPVLVKAIGTWQVK